MLPRQEMEARVVPIALDHGVGPEFVAVPGGENEPARQLLEEIAEFGLVGFRPGVEVVNVAACIRRVGIDQVIRFRGCERLPEILNR